MKEIMVSWDTEKILGGDQITLIMSDLSALELSVKLKKHYKAAVEEGHSKIGIIMQNVSIENVEYPDTLNS